MHFVLQFFGNLYLIFIVIIRVLIIFQPEVSTMEFRWIICDILILKVKCAIRGNFKQLDLKNSQRTQMKAVIIFYLVYIFQRLTLCWVHKNANQTDKPSWVIKNSLICDFNLSHIVLGLELMTVLHIPEKEKCWHYILF